MIAKFEILPFGRGLDEAAELPEPTPLTVTASPTHALDDTVAIGARLAALGHPVTVHLAARMLSSRAHLDELLGSMAQAGIEDAFVIAGDATPPLGPYSSAVELLPVVHEHEHRPKTLGIAGYPEGHPLIDATSLDKALEQKSRHADYVTTQLCFDPEAVLGWVREVRASGIQLPVIVGLPGAVDRRKLLEISMRVGVGASLSFLKKQRGLRNILRLSASSANRLYDALAPHEEVAGFHFFTFNRLLETWRWEQDKRRGSNTIPVPQKEVTEQ